MSVLLSVALLFIFTAPFAVNAVGSNGIKENRIPSSGKSLYSVKGSKAPLGLCQELATLNVMVTDNTLIEIVRMDSGIGTALVVTNAKDETVSKDVIWGIEDDGRIATIQPVDENEAMLRAGYTKWFSDECLSLVKATAVYNILYTDHIDLGNGLSMGTFPIYQPLGVLFFYYDNGVNEVSYVKVVYSCIGIHCTYPDKTPINGYIPTNYPIPVEQYNPNPNTIYSTTDPLAEGTGMHMNDALCTQRLSIEMEVDGSMIEDGVTFIGNE